MFFLATIFLFGFASAQKVTQLTSCTISEGQLRMDCKYTLPAESPQAVCKYTQEDKIVDTTNPEEEQNALYKNNAKVQILEDNNCRLVLKNLPSVKSNFTCSIKQADTASRTSVVDKQLVLPCSGLSVLLQSCSGLLMTLMTLTMLLEIY